MLCLIPKSIPSLAIMLDDIGCGSSSKTKELAQALGVCERTVYGWRTQGYAPRPVMLAIFWLTSWGQSAVNCKAHNDARMFAGYVGSLKAEVADLKAQLAKLAELGDFGSANDPSPGVVGPGPQAPELSFPPIRFPEEPAPTALGEPGSTTGIPRISRGNLRRSLAG